MFCHFIIHSQFEHSLSHTRANGSGSEEPDSALSDNLAVQRNGQIWSRYDFGLRAWSGWVRKLFILTPVVNRRNTVLLTPVESARDHTVQERSRVKGKALIGSERRLTRPVYWFQFSVSVLARYDLWGLDECQQDCVVVYASRSQSDQLRSNENRISEAITARTAQGLWGVSMGRVVSIASLIPIKED